MVHDTQQRVDEIQAALIEAGLDGWLFYDFRGSDPLAYRVLLLDPHVHVTRRWFYWIPARGEPTKVVHRIEPHILHSLPGATQFYVGWTEQQTQLAAMLKDARRVAMQYSPMNAIPYLARVDAGTIELIRSFGVAVESSADLVQRFEAVWSENQLASHREAAEALRRLVDRTFQHVAMQTHAGKRITEYDLQQFMVLAMQRDGFTTSHPPIVAVDRHSADPHYGPAREGSAPIQSGSFLLIDLWMKRTQPGAVYADITWTGFVGRRVPARHQNLFAIVRSARDTAVTFVADRIRAGHFPAGWEVDDVCRRVIHDAGYGEYFLHRTGHSIGEEVHGNGANIDNLETRDGRRLLPRTCFSIEPGIYLPEEFGVRSELDVYVTEKDVQIFGQPIQTEVVPILA